MKRISVALFLFQIFITLNGQIIDHNCTVLSNIPQSFIDLAKSDLHVAYEHTSHGSQIIDGMTGLFKWKGNSFAWNNGGLNGALDIDDHGITGGTDLGAPDLTSWAASTRVYLKNPLNSNVNVVMWAWCSQVSTATENNINTYLNLMSSLEIEFPKVRFVYMTGHLDGTSVNGTLNIRNEQIRNYCRKNNKILYDFADIESYDPDGNYYLDKRANANCDYDSNGDLTIDKNWAITWQNSHPVNVDWYNCPSAHSQPLNANIKAYAAWWLFARVAGWTGPSLTVPVSEIEVTVQGGAAVIGANKGTLQLNALVLPTNATNPNVTWSILNVTGQATISSSGLVTAATEGMVTAKALSDDGTGVYGTLDILILNQIVPVEAISVSGSDGCSNISTDKGTLQLNASVLPTDASNKAVIWSISNVTGQASITSDGLVFAGLNGTIVAKATAADGSGVYGTLDLIISNQIILVEDIIIGTETGLNIIPDGKTTLQLTAQISPTAASVKTVTWNVEDITGQAAIDPAGLVTAISDGKVLATATAIDGTNVKGGLELTIVSRRGDPIRVIVTRQQIKIPLNENFTGSNVRLYDLNGTLIDSKLVENDLCTFDAALLRPGIYIIVLSKSITLKVGKIIIPAYY